MLRFLIEVVVFFAILVVCVLPVRYVAAKTRRRFTFSKWLRGAAIVSFATAGLGWSSRSLQQACLDERNEGCIDAGGAGTQFLLMGGFIAFALGNAYLTYKD